jgi:hypothetical protein
MARTYAQDTTVPAYRSENEVRTMLKSIGASTFGIVESNNQVSLRFMVGSVVYQIERPGLPEIKGKSDEQRERAAWRALVLLVKAKKVAIDQGITTVEREFMADTLLYDGSRLIEHHQQLIESNYDSGVPQIGYTNDQHR